MYRAEPQFAEVDAQAGALLRPFEGGGSLGGETDRPT
jgi:hypothetical protein